jgi:hypothetical protein
MSVTKELDSPPPAQCGAMREQQSPFAASHSPFTIRDVPVVLLGREALPSSAEVTLHYERVHVEGLLELIPSEIEIDISSLASGGAIRIDQLPLPPCCEVIGVWFTNPIVTVA